MRSIEVFLLRAILLIFCASHINREIYVLYGSQTGNAESLAVELSEKLAEAKISSKCMPLNGAKKIELKTVASFLIVICSTTGNGDAPENADGWWRSIKLRSAVSSGCW